MSNSRKSANRNLTLPPPTPFLRWAGGKRKIADYIIKEFPKDFASSAGDFYEPFLGGGALTFALGNRNLDNHVPGARLVINDLNPDLITTYQVVRDDLESLIKELNTLSRDKSREAFEKVRNSKPLKETKLAARFIYLNKTCFNGLWRVNSQGKFNVPWGKLQNPLIYDQSNLEACNQRLQNSAITHLPFASSVESAKKGDLVYFDPPYIPLTKSSNFSSYAKEGFGLLDHYALAGVIKGLTDRGVYVILSNSDTEMTRIIFNDDLEFRYIKANRSISANAAGRIQVSEIVGKNY